MIRKICPHCGTNQFDDPIPGDPEGRRYLRSISVEVPGVYDGGLFWRCPDCGGAWHRWPEGTPLHRRASRYVDTNPSRPS